MNSVEEISNLLWYEKQVANNEKTIQRLSNALIENVELCFNKKQFESQLAATLIQSVVRRKFAIYERRKRHFLRDKCITIQRWTRGIKGRKRAKQRLWKTLSVAPNPYAFKLLRMRCMETETVGNWTEMFDPKTELFWYWNKHEKYQMKNDILHLSEGGYSSEPPSKQTLVEMPYSSWSAPQEFSNKLICQWDDNINISSQSPSQKGLDSYLAPAICGRKFSNRSCFNKHRLTCHFWHCAFCNSSNSALVFPKCSTCDTCHQIKMEISENQGTDCEQKDRSM